MSLSLFLFISISKFLIFNKKEITNTFIPNFGA